MGTNYNDIGISRNRLDAIELRLLGADHRPWGFSREWKAVAKTSRKATRNAIQHGIVGPDKGEETMVDKRVLQRELVLFSLENDATNDMGEFVANSPQDIEDLIAGVKFLQLRLEKAEQEREEFRKEMLGLRIEATELQKRHTELRANWRRFLETMK